MGKYYYFMEERRAFKMINNNDVWKKRGEIIKSARISKGLLQKDLAKILGVKSNTIAGYEAGSRKIDIDDSVTICMFLGIDLALFCGVNRNFKFVKIKNEDSDQRNQLEQLL
jgi:transcriptional regulator with XRE-family HTH domain